MHAMARVLRAQQRRVRAEAAIQEAEGEVARAEEGLRVCRRAVASGG